MAVEQVTLCNFNFGNDNNGFCLFCVGTERDIRDINAYLRYHEDCIDLQILLERIIGRRMLAFFEAKEDRNSKKMVKKANSFLMQKGNYLKSEILEAFLFSVNPDKYCAFMNIDDEAKKEITSALHGSIIWDSTENVRKKNLCEEG